MGKTLPGGNLLGRSGSVLCWPSRSCLCSGEPTGDFSDTSKSDELWRADGTGDSPCRFWYMVAFFSLFLLCQTKRFKTQKLFHDFGKCEQRVPNLHRFTGKFMWQGMNNHCTSEDVSRLKCRQSSLKSAGIITGPPAYFVFSSTKQSPLCSGDLKLPLTGSWGFL